MELAWINDPQPEPKSRECMISGRTFFFGPIVAGSFKYLDDEGGGFWFINFRGTRLGISREW